jgi:hypothetical protein
VTGPASGILAAGFNPKGVQRFANKQKKPKPKKETTKKATDDEKKTILKDDENKENENG